MLYGQDQKGTNKGRLLNDLLIAKTVIVFEPGPAWSWDGWNGQVKLTVESRGTTVIGKDVATKTDLVSLSGKLTGKKYKASGFDSVPGVVASAFVNVNATTLSNVFTIDGTEVAHLSSEGTFMISCVPSLNTSPPTPIPDPCPVKTGSWRVQKSPQSLAKSS